MTTQNTTNAKRSLKQWKATTELPLPSGLTVTVRRPPLSVWFAEGRVPEKLFGSAMASAASGSKTAGMQAEDVDTKELFAFALEVAKAALVWPLVKEDADPESDDEIAPGDIPYLDVMALMAWALEGSPGVPVKTTSGEMSVGALDKFRSDAELRGTGGGGGEVRTDAGGVDGD